MKSLLKSATKFGLSRLPTGMQRKVNCLLYPKAHRINTLLPFIDYLNHHHADLQVAILDIGARLGLCDPGYMELKHLRNYVLEGIEPDAAEAHRLETSPELGRYRKVHALGVAGYSGDALLYMTQLKGCASIRQPDAAQISPYYCASWFEENGQIPIQVTTLDSLYEKSGARFDIIKIDVQGVEAEVLAAGETLLEHAIGISLEAQFVPFYQGQKLFPDLHTFMIGHGFRLIMLHDESHFYDGETIEANCAYIRDPSTFTHRDQLLKAILFALMSGNRRYVEFMLRNDVPSLLPDDEKETLIRLLQLKLKHGKLPLLGPHN
jgi:FkbM family methyltransferase